MEIAAGLALLALAGVSASAMGVEPPPVAAQHASTPGSEVKVRSSSRGTGNVGGKVTVLAKDGARQPGDGAIVYIETVDSDLWAGAERGVRGSPSITQKGKRFEPRVLPILAGQTVAFPNLDPVFHNVFSLTGANKFDLGLYKDGKSKEHAFTAPGVVRVFCNIHPNMTAFILVMQNPWWGMVAPDGSYRLEGVPAGSWTLKAWHERGGESSQAITVEAGQRVDVDFELDARSFKLLPHKNKLGEDYSADAY